MRAHAAIPGDRSFRAKLILASSYVLMTGMMIVIGAYVWNLIAEITHEQFTFIGRIGLLVFLSSNIPRGIAAEPDPTNPYFSSSFPLGNKPEAFHLARARHLWLWSLIFACVAIAVSFVTILINNDSGILWLLGVIPLIFYVLVYSKNQGLSGTEL